MLKLKIIISGHPPLHHPAIYKYKEKNCKITICFPFQFYHTSTKTTCLQEPKLVPPRNSRAWQSLAVMINNHPTVVDFHHLAKHLGSKTSRPLEAKQGIPTVINQSDVHIFVLLLCLLGTISSPIFCLECVTLAQSPPPSWGWNSVSLKSLIGGHPQKGGGVANENSTFQIFSIFLQPLLIFSLKNKENDKK